MLHSVVHDGGKECTLMCTSTVMVAHSVQQLQGEGGRKSKPLLNPIPVQRPFQIIGVDVLELPKTESGNKFAIVFQDFLTKWPMVYPAPNQKAIRIAHLLADEIVPLFGVPEALLSDRGTNL